MALATSPLQRIAVSVAYALIGAVAVIQTAGFPTTVEGWVGIVGAAVIAFWGKYSSSRTVVAANFKS